MNAAIFIITQNTEARRVYLKTTLYFLFKNFNAEYKYPVIIFHEGDYTLEHQREILLGIRASCRACVTFRAVDEGDFDYPEWIDAAKVQRSVDLQVTPYWRNEGYRKMCRWWVVCMPKYAAAYDYVMRVDDDSIIEEPVGDLFEWMQKKDLVYASNMLHIDCALCCYGMKDFFLERFPDQEAILDKMFIEQKLPSRAGQLFPFRSLLSMLYQDNLPEISDSITLTAPIMFYNNFFITKSDFWQRPDVQKVIHDIDKNGSMFYIRWGDAPIHTLITTLIGGKEKTSRAMFKYSKRMQREAFIDDKKECQCYLPSEYTDTTCITQRKSVSESL